MSGRDPAGGAVSLPPQPQPPFGQGKKKAKIWKGKKWVEIDVEGEIRKGWFKYVKFTDDDGLETYWISPE